MLNFREIHAQNGAISHIETPITGRHLLRAPELNKGCAFTADERQDFLLHGRLPQLIETLEDQVARCYQAFLNKPNDLAKNVYLHELYEVNETAFYRLVSEHLSEMMPIVYTPTVSDAVPRYSLGVGNPRGVYISYPDRHRMVDILKNRLAQDVDISIVTDGERVLGIGDQGIGGMGICVAKLTVYTFCAGLNPHRMLPIQLDVGTNNQELLNHPRYMGWKHPRVTGPEYDEFIETFVQAFKKVLPNTYLHWEDFSRDNARRILEKYRTTHCTFNDDMQGTGIVTLANVLSATQAIGQTLPEQRIVLFGAGTAGVGIADQLAEAIQNRGLSTAEALKRIWLVDKQGLLIQNDPDLVDFQKPYARDPAELSGWKIANKTQVSLQEVIEHVHPSILIGCSAMTNAFTERMIRSMAQHVQRPIIMPLSNPNSRSEALPEDLIRWTDGRAIIATGSPFPPINYQGKEHIITQGNNAFIYPALGLGVVISKASQVTDNMIRIAAEKLSGHSPIFTNPNGALLPSLEDCLHFSHDIAKAVAQQAIQDGVARISPDEDLDYLIRYHSWEAKYYPYKLINTCL